MVITPQQPLRDNRVFVVEVAFAGGPVEADPNVLITPWFLTADGSATAPQPDGAHDIFPSNDHPSDKASYLFRIEVPEGDTVPSTSGSVRTRSTTSNARGCSATATSPPRRPTSSAWRRAWRTAT